MRAVAPSVVVPGTALTISGSSFVSGEWGETSLLLLGSGGERRWPARFVDFEHLVVDVTPSMVAEVGDGFRFDGDLVVEVVSAVDGRAYLSDPLTAQLSFAEMLAPSVSRLPTGSILFINDQVVVQGNGFLLGGGEGNSIARVTGCFRLEGAGNCSAIEPVDIPMKPQTPFSRTEATFPFVPAIAGIRPGAFVGEVAIINQHQGGAGVGAAPVPANFDVVDAQVTQVTPTDVSLGQYVVIEGGGFVGGEPSAFTELELSGTFLRTGAPAAVPVNLSLIPEFVNGNQVRYVLSEQDVIGQILDLRMETGTFEGMITPITEYKGVRVTGVGRRSTFSIAPIKQVVFLDFRPTYVESLRAFGLRAVDAKIRDRIIAVVRRAYAGVNLEVRTELPNDFALYSHVELHGQDPNGQGLFGYDNTPGKDNNNVRLYDRLGGVNAATQRDGYPGFGGVFVESLMGFSLNPGRWADSIGGADPLFDKIFDAFRTDRDGTAISSRDRPSGIAVLTRGESCPSPDDRQQQMGCAVFVLGNLIGSTLAHEIGHSLGLANPNQQGFHNNGNAPNRLMDAGGDRPFAERAELSGLGPAVFCTQEYSYLRNILPSSTPAPDIQRPNC